MDEFDKIVEEFGMERFDRIDGGRVGFINISKSTTVDYDKPIYEKIGDTLHDRGFQHIEIDIFYKLEILAVCPPLGDDKSNSLIIIHPVKIYLRTTFVLHEPIMVALPEVWPQADVTGIRTELDLVLGRHEEHTKNLVAQFLIQQAVVNALS